MYSFLQKLLNRSVLVLGILFFSGTLFCQANQTFWWNDAVFYEVFVRSFKDNNGDGKGDLKGLIEKLDYLNDGDSATHTDLGITAIWLMPVQQSPSYHGYDAIDYRTVEQDYGTNQDFKDFIAEAHSRGIKVIIDYVMNHTSSQHPWFQAALDPMSDKRNWYVWQDPKPSNLGPWGQTVWHTRNGGNYYGIFWSEMPDLNYNTPEVKTEMFDAARFWLEDMGVDGFRLDAIKYIFENGTTLEDTPETINFWKDFRTHYKTINADAFAVGEAWTSTNKVGPYVYNNGLDYCFEFDLASAILNAANSANVSGLQSKITEVISTYPHLQYGTFLTNHDMNRAMTQLGSNTSKAKLAADLLLTLPGIPYLYYGEEIGMTGSGADENKRTPMQWTNTSQAGFSTATPWRPVNADYSTKNVGDQQFDTTSLWHHYRKLIALRNNQLALKKGDYKSVSASAAAVFSFLRQSEDEAVLVVSNTSGVAASNVVVNIAQSGIAAGNYSLVELQSGEILSIMVDNAGGFSNLAIPTIPIRSTKIYKLLEGNATAANVTFEVDMNAMITSGDFLPGSETVDIVASFNDYGNTITVLSDDDQDGIYSVTISGNTIGSKVHYKYRINGVNNGREEFTNSSHLRSYLVLEGKNKVRDPYQKLYVTSIKNSLRDVFSVYPIPANKEITIECKKSYSGIINYQIIDALGVERISSTLSGGISESQVINCEDLSAGVYQLRLQYNGVGDVYRIVIQK